MFSQKAASFARASLFSFILSSPPFCQIYLEKISTRVGTVKLAAVTASLKMTGKTRGGFIELASKLALPVVGAHTRVRPYQRFTW